MTTQLPSIVFCAYRPEDCRRSWETCRSLKRELGGAPLTVVANSEEAHRMSFPDADLLIRGSNRRWEWSAYAEGLDSVRVGQRAHAGVLFVNDTLHEHQLSAGACGAVARKLERCRDSFLLGCLDRAPFSDLYPTMLGYEITDWISTWLFYVSRPALDALGTLTLDLSSLLPELSVPAVEATFLEGVPEPLADYLAWWLFGGGWKKSTALTEANQLFFKAKMESILHEFLLTARARRIGRIIDARWQLGRP